MRRLIVFFIIFACIENTAFMSMSVAPEPSLKVKPRRLTMFLDYCLAEDLAGLQKSFAIGGSFSINLKQKASSCIVHHTIFEHFLTLKLNNEIKFFEESFTFEVWNIYHIPGTPLFAIIKHDDDINDYRTNYDEKSSVPFYKNSTWEPYRESKSDLKKVLTFVQSYSSDKYSDFSIDHLNKIFSTQDDIKKYPSIQKYWETMNMQDSGASLRRLLGRPLNCLIFGHGSVGGSIAGIKGEYFSKLLTFFNTLNTHLIYIDTCSAGGKNTHYMTHEKITSKGK